MNAIIDNPKRIVTIDRSADYVRDRLKVIDKWAGSHAGIIISQPNLHITDSYTFTCDGFGARPGGQGRVVVTPVDEGSCTVMVAIGRPSGRVDDRAEAKLRSEQIDAFLKILSYLINNNITVPPTDEQLQDMCRANGGSGVTAALVALGVIGLLIIVLI